MYDIIINIFEWYLYRKCFYFVEFYFKNVSSKFKIFVRIFGYYHIFGNCV